MVYLPLVLTFQQGVTIVKSSNWSEEKIRGVRTGILSKVEYSAKSRDILVSFTSGSAGGGNSGFADLLGNGENSPKNLYLVLGDQELAAIFASLSAEVQERILDMATVGRGEKELTA